MGRYSNYKQSSYDWLGRVPQHWDEKFLEQTASEKCVKNSRNTVKQVLSLSYGEIKKKNNLNKGLIAQDLSTYQIVEPGDIIMRLTDLQNDHKSLRTGIVKNKGIITAAYLCLCPKINPEYLHYTLRAYDVKKVFYGMGGGVRQSIGFKDVRHMYVPVPPRAEQDQIVRFLDWKISEINKLIGINRRQIGLLKEIIKRKISDIIIHGVNDNVPTKNSGTTWIGTIPADWQAIRCKYLFHERNQRSETGEEQHLSMSQKYGLIPDSMLDERRMLSVSYKGGKICYKDDLVLNRLKAHLGVFALAPQFGVISPDYTVLQPNITRVIPAYAEMVLKSQPCRRELRIRVRGIIEGFWRLYTDDFNTIVIPVPPIEEQKKIMSYVDEYKAKTNNYIAMMEKEIEILRELRSTIISDVVTGKIDVRNIPVPAYEHVDDMGDDDGEDNDEETGIPGEED